MRAIKKSDHYFTFNIDEIGTECFNRLIQDAFKVSNKVLIDNPFDIDEEPYNKTQIPYSSGFIQERFVYYITNSLANYVLTAIEAKDAFELFFCNYLCWDFYDQNVLILSINIVQNIISVNSVAIDLTDYNCEEAGLK